MKVFFVGLVLAIIVYIVVGVFAYIASKAGGAASVILYIIAVILGLISTSILIGAQATLYEKLVGA